MNMLARQSSGGWLVAPQNMSEVYAFAKTIAESTFCPKDMRGRAGDVIAAIQLGSELGMSPMAALQGICVINGRPSLYGDALLALVLAQPDVIDVVEEYDDKTRTASCTVIRQRGTRERSTTRTFSMDDAVKAKLASKTGPWTDYPKRMQAMRARSWALRDSCPDILRGMIAHEEAQDIPQQLQATVVQEVPRSKPGDSPRTLVSDIKERVERMQPIEPKREPQREESSSGTTAAPGLPLRTSKNYAVKEYADCPFVDLPDAALTAYLDYYSEKLPEVTQKHHRNAVIATCAAAEAELERRLAEEGQPLAADSTPEEEAREATMHRSLHSDEKPAFDPETGEVLDHPPSDSLAPLLEASIEMAREGIEWGNTNDALGLVGADAPANQAKRSTRKGAA
jgi:hypothetical protein